MPQLGPTILYCFLSGSSTTHLRKRKRIRIEQRKLTEYVTGDSQGIVQTTIDYRREPTLDDYTSLGKIAKHTSYHSDRVSCLEKPDVHVGLDDPDDAALRKS